MAKANIEIEAIKDELMMEELRDIVFLNKEKAQGLMEEHRKLGNGMCAECLTFSPCLPYLLALHYIQWSKETPQPNPNRVSKDRGNCSSCDIGMQRDSYCRDCHGNVECFNCGMYHERSDTYCEDCFRKQENCDVCGDEATSPRCSRHPIEAEGAANDDDNKILCDDCSKELNLDNDAVYCDSCLETTTCYSCGKEDNSNKYCLDCLNSMVEEEKGKVIDQQSTCSDCGKVIMEDHYCYDCYGYFICGECGKKSDDDATCHNCIESKVEEARE